MILLVYPSLFFSGSFVTVFSSGSRPMWLEDGHRVGPARCTGGFIGKEKVILQEQCPASMAIHNPRFAQSWCKEVLRQILLWVSRPH